MREGLFQLLPLFALDRDAGFLAERWVGQDYFVEGGRSPSERINTVTDGRIFASGANSSRKMQRALDVVRGM